VPLVAGVLTWGATTAFTLLTEGRYNKWLESTFSRYLAPSVIEALKRDPELLKLGGTRREVTVLFSDIAGFTSISEGLPPERLSELLNRYLTPHCDAVFAHDGTVDKFIGDAVVAFYGDPIPQADHALRGCRTALEVQAALPALEPVWRGMGLSKFEVRIGLNSGVATLGNMGSAQRFNYTALGDTVNLASRLEGANKAFGTRILLGEATRAAAGDAVLAKSLGRLVVVGKEEPVGVHELVALRERATPDEVHHVEAFARAVAAAKSGDLAAARTALSESERLRPGDGACAWFATLLAKLASGAEPSPWSGVVTLTGK
jgi:adenylate cyclase